jgi:hypothetical protein
MAQIDVRFEQERAKYYFTAVYRVLAGISVYERAGMFSPKKVHMQGVAYTFPEPGRIGPQCATVPVKLNRNQDLDKVTPLGDRFALEARSQFARVYRDKGLVRVEFTLPPEQWTKVRSRDLPHRKGHPSFGKLSLGQVAHLSFEISPHKLVSGGTQKGKTTTLMAIIYSLAKGHSPDELKMLILNPKRDKKLDRYCRLPHLKEAPIAHDMDECVNLLRMAIGEMELRAGDEERQKVRWVIFADEVAVLVQQRPET